MTDQVDIPVMTGPTPTLLVIGLGAALATTLFSYGPAFEPTKDKAVVIYSDSRPTEASASHRLATRIIFQSLHAQWIADTNTASSDFMMLVTNKAYQRIIALGRDVVPLILETLSKEPDHWSWALEAITGENPAPPDASGDIEAMTEAWLRWGRSRLLVA